MSDIEVPAERRIRTIETKGGRSRLFLFSPYVGIYQFAVETDWEDEGYTWTQVSVLSGYYDNIEVAQWDGIRELAKLGGS